LESPGRLANYIRSSAAKVRLHPMITREFIVVVTLRVTSHHAERL